MKEHLYIWYRKADDNQYTIFLLSSEIQEAYSTTSTKEDFDYFRKVCTDNVFAILNVMNSDEDVRYLARNTLNGNKYKFHFIEVDW